MQIRAKLEMMPVAPSVSSGTGSDIRGRVTESEPSTSTHRYPNPDPLVFDYLTRFWFCFVEPLGSTVKDSLDHLHLQTRVPKPGPNWAKLEFCCFHWLFWTISQRLSRFCSMSRLFSSPHEISRTSFRFLLSKLFWCSRYSDRFWRTHPTVQVGPVPETNKLGFCAELPDFHACHAGTLPVSPVRTLH